MKIIRMIVAMLAALLCWQLVKCDGAVEPQIGGMYRVTAYCPCEKCCGRYADGITASGHRIKKGDRFIAADPNIPFGIRFIIPGYNDDKPVLVLDRGGAIKGKCIDVFFDDHQQALNWGVKWLKVIRIEGGI